MLAVRRACNLKETRAEITSAGGCPVDQPTDSTSAHNLTRTVERALTEFGHLDWSVNIAGVTGRS